MNTSAETSDPIRILVIGRDGQLGDELTRSLASLGDVTATGHEDLNLDSYLSIRSVVRSVWPGLIVNAGAYTAVDKAESEPDLAKRINTDAVAMLAVEARTIGAAVIHYSTDYVFDGEKTGPYVEEDTPNPLNVYGRTKLGGERELARAGVPYLVLRTSWVYGTRGKNFLRTILKLAAEKPELRIVADQIGAPTWSRDIAAATARIAGRWLRGGDGTPKSLMEHSGNYHLAAAGETSWYGFAEEALRLRQSALGANGKLARVIPISSAEYPTAAARPKNSRLDCSKLALGFNCQLPEWKASLVEVLKEMDSPEA